MWLWFEVFAKFQFVFPTVGSVTAAQYALKASSERLKGAGDSVLTVLNIYAAFMPTAQKVCPLADSRNSATHVVHAESSIVPWH